MHRAKEFMEDIAEELMTAMGELDDNADWTQYATIADMAEGFNEIYEACCNIKKLMSTDYDMEHRMHGGHDMDHDEWGNRTEGHSAKRRQDKDHDGHYYGEMEVTDQHGNKEHYRGEAKVKTGL